MRVLPHFNHCSESSYFCEEARETRGPEMKLFYFFLFSFTNGINPTRGQLHEESSGEFLLRMVFSSKYVYYEKSCCKFTSSGCIIFVGSNGYVHNAYRGRLETYKYPQAYDVRIWNVRAEDAGTYRCNIHGTLEYQDFQVFIVGTETKLNPILSFSKSTVSPVSSVHHLLHQDISSNKWSLEFILGTISGVVIIILVVSVALIVIYKKKLRDKRGRSFPRASNVQQPPQELIYTTVNFERHQKTCNIYTNLAVHSSRPDAGDVLETQDRVEYATVARVS